MADTKISNLAAVTGLIGTDEFVLARSGDTKKIAASDLATAFAYGELAYVEFTSTVTVNATAEGTPNEVVSAGAVSYDGTTRVKLEFFAGRCNVGTTAGSFVVCNLWDGDSTDLGRIAVAAAGAASGISLPLYGVRFLTPSNASHTYKIKAWRVNSDGAIFGAAGGAGVTLPGFVRVTVA